MLSGPLFYQRFSSSIDSRASIYGSPYAGEPNLVLSDGGMEEERRERKVGIEGEGAKEEGNAERERIKVQQSTVSTN